MSNDLTDIRNLINETHAQYEAFGEYYDLMYAAQGEKAGTYRPDVAEAYADLIQSLGCKEVLDCACGTGDPIIGVALQGNIKITASDISDSMLSKCLASAQQYGLLDRQVSTLPASGANLEILKSCWQELPAVFGSNKFDMVMCIGHGFFHLISRENMVAAVRSMVDVVKPGGYVVFDAIRREDAADLHQELGKGSVIWRGWAQQEKWRFMFLSSCNYIDDDQAVDGVIQAKTVHVIEENCQINTVSSSQTQFTFYGAPLLVSTAIEIAREAGLVDIHEVDIVDTKYMTKYVTFIGLKI